MSKVNKKKLVQGVYEICLNLTIKTSERRYWCRSGVFIVNYEHVSHFVLVFLLLTSSRSMQSKSMNWFYMMGTLVIKELRQHLHNVK